MVSNSKDRIQYKIYSIRYTVFFSRSYIFSRKIVFLSQNDRKLSVLGSYTFSYDRILLVRPLILKCIFSILTFALAIVSLLTGTTCLIMRKERDNELSKRMTSKLNSRTSGY